MVLAILAGLATFIFLFLAHTVYHFLRGHPKPHIAAASHLHWHAIVGIIVGLIISSLVGFAVYRTLGVKFQADKHITPSARFIKAGLVAPPAWSLASSLPNYVYDQGNLLACVAFSLNTARWMEASGGDFQSCWRCQQKGRNPICVSQSLVRVRSSQREVALRHPIGAVRR